jgi:hypothetical protein
MTVIRLLHPSVKSAIEIAAGLGLIVLPSVLGLSAAAIVAGVAIGAIVFALGVAGTAMEGRGTLPLSAQAVYDRGLALGLFASAVLFGLADQSSAAGLFAAAALLQLTLTVTTRYSAARA